MIANPKEQKICDKYGARDNTNHVHCFECPLNKSQGDYDFHCKANSHYNRKTKEWEYDYEKEVVKLPFHRVKQSVYSI